LPSAILRIQVEELSVRQDDTVWNGSKDIRASSLQCGRIGRTHNQGANTHDLGGASRCQDGWRDVTSCLHNEPQRCFNPGVSHPAGELRIEATTTSRRKLGNAVAHLSEGCAPGSVRAREATPMDPTAVAAASASARTSASGRPAAAAAPATWK